MGAIIDGEVLLLAFGVVAKLVIVAAVGATAAKRPRDRPILSKDAITRISRLSAAVMIPSSDRLDDGRVHLSAAAQGDGAGCCVLARHDRRRITVDAALGKAVRSRTAAPVVAVAGGFLGRGVPEHRRHPLGGSCVHMRTKGRQGGLRRRHRTMCPHGLGHRLRRIFLRGPRSSSRTARIDCAPSRRPRAARRRRSPRKPLGVASASPSTPPSRSVRRSA